MDASALSPPDTAIRVLHVITRMVKGGAQENTLATVVGIHGGGWDSALVTGPAEGPEGSLEPECLAAGVHLLRVSELVREISPARDLLALVRLTALFRRERPQIVHTHTSKAGILGRIAARRAGVPIMVHTPHGHVFHGYYGPAKSALFRALERACAPLADRIICLTNQCRNEHIACRIAPDERFVTIHSGVDFRPFEETSGLGPAIRAALGLASDDLGIGCVARLVPIKGHRYLLDAFARVAREEPRAILLLVGDGPLRSELEEQARRLGIVSHVRFLGLRSDVPKLLAGMDLFVLPSLNEGMGRVLVEAMAMRLPVVASDVAGIPDVVRHGVTGLLVPPAAPGPLGDAILELLRDPARRRSMGDRGRETAVPAFSVETMVERIEALYRELLAQRGLSIPGSRRSVGSALTG